MPSVIGGAGLQKPHGGRVTVQPGIDGQLEMVVGIISGGIGSEAPPWSVLESLVHRQDDDFSCAGQAAMIEQAVKVRKHTRVLPSVSFEYRFDFV